MSDYLDYVQTDSVADCLDDAWGHPWPLHSVYDERKALVGGTPGTGTQAFGFWTPPKFPVYAISVWELPLTGKVVDAGTWTVAVDISDIVSDSMRFDNVYIFRVNSSCSLVSTMGSAVNLNHATKGVKSVPVDIASGFTPASGDKACVVLGAKYNASSGGGSITIRQGQAIQTTIYPPTTTKRITLGTIHKTVKTVLVG